MGELERELHERSASIAAIRLLADNLRNGVRGTLLVVGEAGLGKTTLLRWARAAAPEIAVSTGCGQAMEVDLPFGLAARTWLAARAATAPVLLLFDDLHRADPDSLELVAFLSRRIRKIPIGIIGTLRRWPPAAANLAGRLVTEGSASAVTLEPLSRASADRMLTELIGAQTSPGLADRAWGLGGGNPLLVEQLAGIIAAEGGLPDPTGFNPGRFRNVLLLSAFGDLHGWAAFAHPLIGRAVYDDLAPVQRARLHARAFERLSGLGEISLAAHHAVAADLVGDAAAIATVRAAGALSVAAGAVLTAVDQLRAAIELSAGTATGELHLQLADALLAAGRPAEAVQSYRDGIDGPGVSPALRVQGLPSLARALAYSGDLPGSQRASTEALA